MKTVKKTVRTEKKNDAGEGKNDLEKLLGSLQEKFGEGAVMTLGEVRRVNVNTISSGSFSLDAALGAGGFPKGRIVEVFGPEMSGKSTLALHVIAETQKKNGKAAYIDAEHALDPEYAAALGVKLKDLLISQPDSGEEALNILESLVRSGIIDLVVIDSVAALTPKAEIEGEMGAQYIGLQARLMSQALRKITALAAKTDTLIIFINQLREKIGMMGYGDPTTTPGGRALKFYSSVRIDLRRIAQIKKGEDVVGSRVRAKTVKNKVAPPFKTVEFDIMFGKGISYEGDLLTSALKYGIVEKSGNTYSFNGEKLGVGFEAAKEKIAESREIFKELEKRARAALDQKI